MIGGSFVNILVLTVFGGGLLAPASPGSIFAELLMTAPGSYIANILAITLSAVTSFLLAVPLLKAFGKDEGLEAAVMQRDSLKAQSKGGINNVKSILFACDAGMGSSAMGETILKKKLAEAGLGHIKVTHLAIEQIQGNPEIIIVHKQLRERVAQRCPNAKIITVDNFIGAAEYDVLVRELSKK
jgi:PTS system mannitol-specific IIC component